MNFLSVYMVFNGLIYFLSCENTEQSDPIILKAFLMECPKYESKSSHKNIQIAIQIPEKTTFEASNESFVKKILLSDVSATNGKFKCEIETPHLVEVSNDEFVLMYPLKLETSKQLIWKAKIDGLDEVKDVHNANNVKLLDDIYYTRLQPSDFLHERSDFMHTKDLQSDSIYTKNFKKDNNKNNANNEYANDEFRNDENQGDNENTFSGKRRLKLNNNEIDNFNNNEMNSNENDIINDIGYFTRNLYEDKNSWNSRKNIKERKNEFIKCVGLKNFKKIDHLLCTCAKNVDEVDETKKDEQSDCLHLINNVCLWGPLCNKNINLKHNEDGKDLNYRSIKPTSLTCCDLLPPFFLALGQRCYKSIAMGDDTYDDYGLYDEINNKLPEFVKSKDSDPWPQLLQAPYNLMFDKKSYMNSNTEKIEKITKNKLLESELKSLLHLPKHINKHMNYGKFRTNPINSDRFSKLESGSSYDIEIPKKPYRSTYKKEAMPFDKEIYDPHLNIADKMQLINMISPKRPCERNRLTSVLFNNRRQKRSAYMMDQSSLSSSSSMNDKEDYPETKYRSDQSYSDYSEPEEMQTYSDAINESVEFEDSVEKIQMICSQYPCALALPLRKDPYFRREVKFLDNNGTSLNLKENAENMCRNQFNSYILIPYEYVKRSN